jgi:HK97 gp10 family phage protein
MRMQNFRPEVVAAISQSPTVARAVRLQAAAVRNIARINAPKRTGQGAKSIAVARDYDRATRTVSYRVSWSKDRFYMWFMENGTRKGLPARRFLRNAAEQVQRNAR